MFEGLKLNQDLIDHKSESLRKKVSLLSEEERKEYYDLFIPMLKDHDTYAVLNYFLLAGLHHFYLGKLMRGSLNLTVLITGISLIIFTKYIFVGTLAIFFILLTELLALFRSQIIVKNHNNLLSEKILNSISKT